MPTLFARTRRYSESVTSPTDSQAQQKRGSVDLPNAGKRGIGAPPSASAKFKSFIRSKGDTDTEKRDSLRKRLSSPSTFFSRSNGAEESMPSVSPLEATDRYLNVSPRETIPDGAHRTSPNSNLSPENFAISRTTSPEATYPRRGSVSWQPSYPTAVDDAYADVPPDGLARDGFTSFTTMATSENNLRRTGEQVYQGGLPSPEDLPGWPALNPAAKTSTPPQTFPTPPPSVVSPGRSSTQPSPVLREPTPPTAPLSSMKSINGTTVGSGSAGEGSTLAIVTPSVLPGRPARATARATQSRPDMPPRQSTIIRSPPMPQPIKNLPTLVGWSGFKDETAGTNSPGWGELAREGGPKTPGGFGGMGPNGAKSPVWGLMSPSGPRTPGLTGFPFSTSSVVTNKSKEKGAMSEDELRRARRRMVSTLSQPSADTFLACHDAGAIISADTTGYWRRCWRL